jgi:DNA helicase II / ATP-dependent DNA helicase PcrA
MHSAKGQEWSSVVVLSVVDGCIPSDMASGSAAEIDEERRLLYVAMTRAKRHLALVVPLRFHVMQQARFGDRHLYGALTRFIPPEVAALFDRADPQPTPHEADAARASAAAVDLPARVRELF